jgi:hypothetical protein
MNPKLIPHFYPQPSTLDPQPPSSSTGSARPDSATHVGTTPAPARGEKPTRAGDSERAVIPLVSGPVDDPFFNLDAAELAESLMWQEFLDATVKRAPDDLALLLEDVPVVELAAYMLFKMHKAGLYPRPPAVIAANLNVSSRWLYCAVERVEHTLKAGQP